MKRFAAVVALALVFVMAMSTVAMAVPSGGANNNPLGAARAAETRHPFGAAQSEFVMNMEANGFMFNGVVYYDYGQFLGAWKALEGFKQ